MFKVTKEPLSVQEVNDLVKRPTDGAVVTFDGIVRNNFDGRPVRFLEYEAYAEMAEKKMSFLLSLKILGTKSLINLTKK